MTTPDTLELRKWRELAEAACDKTDWKSSALALEMLHKSMSGPKWVALLDRLDALEGREAWQPIETAPRDGTKFDGWQRDERVTDMYWSDIQDAWCVDGTYGPEEPTPLAFFPRVSHWRPLPEAPTTLADEGRDQ